jgi:hypothetical protein
MKHEDQLRVNTVLAASQARAAEGYTANTAITLSAEREAQLAQWNLQARSAAKQTARIAYARALGEYLPKNTQ